jgi:4-hydroxy-2-oxoheptanedioate aldolase
MKQNRVLARVRAGEPAVIGWLVSGAPMMAEMMAPLGFDGLLLDAQHGYWSYEGLLQALLIVGDSDTTPLVRVAENNYGIIGRTLDAGALGIIVPMVNTAEQAQKAVAYCRYPPDGDRSSGGIRRDRYGTDYIKAANSEIMLTIMIETRQAVERVDEIISVPGIDCVMIGPGDLAMSLGCFPERGEEHEGCLMRVLEACQRQGVPMGMACSSTEECVRRAGQGMVFLPCGNEIGWARAGGAAHLEAVRAAIAEAG